MCCASCDHQEDQPQRLELVERPREPELLTALHVQSLSLNIFVDRNYMCRHVNRRYLEYWSQRRQDVADRDLADIVGADTFHEQLKPLLDRALAGESSNRYSTQFYPGFGNRHMEVTYLPARDDTGNIVGVVISARDATTMVERNEQLTRKVTALEQHATAQQAFIHFMAHDLREPVNTIVNFALLLVGDEPSLSPSDRRNFLARVLHGGQRLQALIDDLMKLVRLDAQQMPSEAVDLNALVNEVCNDLAHAIARAGARVEVRSLPTVRGERYLLSLLVQNLISNAIKFSRKHVAPEVTISACSSATEHEICVSDNGIGIPPSQTERIFEMFHRLHSRKEYEGTGLGLHICKRIAELHGGRIWTSARKGGGSRFHLMLPVRESNATGVSAP